MDEKVAPIADISVRALAGPGRRYVLNPQKTSMKTRGSVVSTRPFLNPLHGQGLRTIGTFPERTGHFPLFIYPVQIIVPSRNMRGDGLREK
jgi:hypothetical protein